MWQLSVKEGEKCDSCFSFLTTVRGKKTRKFRHLLRTGQAKKQPRLFWFLSDNSATRLVGFFLRRLLLILHPLRFFFFLVLFVVVVIVCCCCVWLKASPFNKTTQPLQRFRSHFHVLFLLITRIASPHFVVSSANACRVCVSAASFASNLLHPAANKQPAHDADTWSLVPRTHAAPLPRFPLSPHPPPFHFPGFVFYGPKFAFI